MFAYRMKPYFRHGEDTPWGGEGLKRYFNKEIPDNRTGESLEASTLFDAKTHTGESCAEDGRTLSEIAGQKLPLLLKLIDARETLSVQVHPNDLYAKEHADGKNGKTEAWVILHAEPGAKLVYGLKEGINIQSISKSEIESSLHWVPVKVGDVFYIPAGMVHAIGAGIILYEIQQASDVTYRFWDWGRLSADGSPRALHFDQAREVARHFQQSTSSKGIQEHCSGGMITHYLDTAYFTLKRFHISSQMTLPESTRFAFLTALCEGRLSCEGVEIPFQLGDTLFIPACQKRIQIITQGDLLYSAEA